MTERYDLIVFKKYKWQGKDRYKPYFVGDAIAAKKPGDFVLDIPKGVSVSGRVIMSPKSDETRNHEDLVTLYMSAADELGM